jgi:PAS domain S-box-containing protein
MKTPLRVLIVTDFETDVNQILREFEHSCYDPNWRWIKSINDQRPPFAETWDVVVCDSCVLECSDTGGMRLPGKGGNSTPLFILADKQSEETARAAMLAGASDYFLKDDLIRFIPAIHRELKRSEISVGNKQTLSTPTRFDLSAEVQPMAGGGQSEIHEDTSTLEELRRSLAYNRNLIEVSLDPLITIDADGKVTDVNRAMETATGCGREQLIGSDFPSFFTDPEKARAGYQRVFREGEVHDYPLEIRHREGKLTSVLYNAIVYCDDDGQVPGVFASARDVTELKRALERLRESEEEYRLLAETSTDFMIAYDLEGMMTYANKAALNVLGVSEAEILQRDIASIAAPEQLEFVKRQHSARLNGDQSIFTYETEIQAAAGRRVSVEVKSGPIVKEGKVVGVLVTARDITERKQTERQIRHLASFPQFNPNPIVEIDLSGEVTYCNPEAQDLLAQLKLSDARVLLPADVDDILKSIGPDQVDAIHREVTISNRIIEESIQFVPGFGTVRIYGRDVTSRKAAERRAGYYMRLYATLSQVNQTIVRAKDRLQLYHDICEVAIQYGKFRMAWIGLADEPTGRVIPIAISGHEDGYLESIHITRNVDEESGRGPTGAALRDGRLVICDDIEHDPLMKPWRQAALKRGYRSSAALPLLVNNIPIGVFTIYAAEPGFFTEDEAKLLEEIGEDISFALASIEREDQRKLDATALEASEERYRSLVDNIPDVVWRTDASGATSFVTSKIESIFGFTPEEIYRDSTGLWFGRIHPDDIEGVKASFENLVQTGEPFDVEYRIKRKDGHWIWLHDRGRRSYDELGQIRVDGVFTDVTEQKRAEEALFAQAQLLEAFFENTLTSNVILDSKFNFVQVNQVYASACTLEKEAFQGRNHFELFPSDAEEIFHSVIASRKPYSVKARPFVFLDQPERGVTYWDWVLVPLLTDEGDVDKLIFTLNDVTEQRVAEMRLEETAKLLARERELLERKNIALGEVLDRIEKEKEDLRRQISTNLELTVLPTLLRLEVSANPMMRKSLEMLRRDLKEITSPFLTKLKDRFDNLSPRETEICRMIRSGMTSKEIADTLRLSPMTVQKFRELIRKKLDLTNADINLNTYLRSMT